MTTTFLQFRIKISLILVLKTQASRLFQFLSYLFLGHRSLQKFTTTKKKKKLLRPTVSKLTKSHKSKTKLTWKWWCRFLRKIKIANCKPKLKNHVHDCWQQSMALSQIVTPIPWESIERQVKCDYRFRDSSQMWLPLGASVQWNLITWKLRFYRVKL